MKVKQYLSRLVAVGVSLLPISVMAEQVSLQLAEQTLQVDTDHGLKITLSHASQVKMALEDVQFNYQSALNWKIKRQAKNEIVLQASFKPGVEFYRTVNDNQPRQAILTISKVDGGFRFYSAPDWGRQVKLKLKDLGSHIFGLTEGLQPDNRLSPDLRNATVHVDVNAEEASIHENYASAHSAFFMSSLGYGAFFDTFARGTYDIAINGYHTIQHDSKTLDWYVFPGKNGTQIHKAYFALIGAPKAVPAWGLGPVGWRDQNDGGAAEMLDDIAKMSDRQMPFTAWFVDRPYSDGTHGWSQMNFSPLFADPAKWINTMREQYGLEFMTWTTPAFFGATPFAKHLDGDFSYIDVSDAQSQQAFKQALVDKQLQFGVKGHKIDRADEAFPVSEKWADESVLPAYRRNLYTYLMTKMHDEALRSVWGDDQITFTRSAIHRSQPYLSAIWAGDPRTSWDGLQANFANAARSSFMGFPVWGTDVGGYQGEGYIPQDLYLRWMQAGSMTGLFEIKLDGAGGDGRDRMPWQYDDNFQKQFKHILDDRMALVPYLYSLVHTSAQTGTVMQPLAYRHLDDKNTYQIWDEFYVGDAILVAPVFTPENQRSVYLPEGNWRDFDDPAVRYQGGKRYDLKIPLAKLPRFVKANSLFVSGNLYHGSDKIWRADEQPTLTIHAFPAVKQGETQFQYVDLIDNKHKTISLKRDAKQLVVNSPAVDYARVFEVVTDTAPKTVVLNGKAVDFSFKQQQNLLLVTSDSQDDLRLQVTF